MMHFDGDGSHLMKAAARQAWADRGLIMIFPKPNTSSDTQGEDLVTYGIMQPLVRENIAKRMRFLKMRVKVNRELDGRDVVAIMAPTMLKAQTAHHNLSAWRVRGLSPFTRQPLQQPHILATKGKDRPQRTLNFDKLDFSKPIHAQVREQLGKGVRLTSGFYSGKPYTHEGAIRMDAALEKEKEEKKEAK